MLRLIYTQASHYQPFNVVARLYKFYCFYINQHALNEKRVHFSKFIQRRGSAPRTPGWCFTFLVRHPPNQMSGYATGLAGNYLFVFIEKLFKLKIQNVK